MELILRVWHSLLDGMVRSAQQPSSCRSDSSPFTPQKRPCAEDRKSTRLNSSHSQISYAVFCLKKKKKIETIKLRLSRTYPTHHRAADRIHSHVTTDNWRDVSVSISHTCDRAPRQA